MTDQEMGEFARRLVACPKFRWLRGMANMQGLRVIDAAPYFPPGASVLPDLRDAATLGCLLQLVREAWPMPMRIELYDDECEIIIEQISDGPDGRGYYWTHLASGPSQAGVLVAALEAAHAHAENSAVRTTGNATS